MATDTQRLPQGAAGNEQDVRAEVCEAARAVLIAKAPHPYGPLLDATPTVDVTVRIARAGEKAAAPRSPPRPTPVGLVSR